MCIFLLAIWGSAYKPLLSCIMQDIFELQIDTCESLTRWHEIVSSKLAYSIEMLLGLENTKIWVHIGVSNKP